MKGAEKALMYYKGCKAKSEQEKQLFKIEFERMKLIEEERKQTAEIEMNDIFNRMALKGIVISIAMAWFQQTTGSYLITNYAYLIFKISGTVLSIDASAIILAIAQIIGGLVSTQLGDTFDRKTTLHVSLLGSATGLFIFAIYSYMQQTGHDVSNYLWLPVICLSVVMFISSAGVMPLANICAIENFPRKVFRIFINSYQ